MLLTLEELAILLVLEPDFGLQKETVVWQSTGLYGGERFDTQVARNTIDRLVGLDLMSRDRSGFLYITTHGQKAIKDTCEYARPLLSKLMVYG